MSDRSGKSKKRKSRGWRVKEKAVKKSRNKGLPGSFIKSYGKPVERQLITKDVWQAFYMSDEGKQRGQDLWARTQERGADLAKLASLKDQPAVPVLNSKTKLDQIILFNANGKASARIRDGIPIGQQRIAVEEEEGA